MVKYFQNIHTEANAKIQTGLRKELQEIKGHLCSFESHNFYVYDDDTLLGGVIFEQHDNIIWIDSLWVHEAHRGKGIGKKLISHVVDFALDHHCNKIQLTTYFAISLPFYEKLDFVILSSIPHWKYGVECYFLEKVIGQ